jgi:hypothetical protein
MVSRLEEALFVPDGVGTASTPIVEGLQAFILAMEVGYPTRGR